MARWSLRRRRAPSARVERDEWLTWLELGGASPKTVDGYRRTTEKFLERWPDLAMRDISDEQLVGFIEEASLASRMSRRAPFANWFRWAERTRRVDENPMRFVPTYKQQKAEPMEVFSDAECARLVELPEPDGTLMAVLLGTGIRKAEARHLSVRRLDLDHAEVHIVEAAKGGSIGVIPIAQSLVDRLRAYIEAEQLGEDDFLWYCHPGGSRKRRHDRPIAEAAMHNWWTRCVEEAGVKYRNLHNTRHTYATQWRRRGLSLDDVSDALRHADPRTTRRVYIHTTSIDLRKRMEAVADES